MYHTRRSFLTRSAAAGTCLLVRPSASAAVTGRSPFPEFDANGTPGDLGLAHGRRFRTEIERTLAFYDI